MDKFVTFISDNYVWFLLVTILLIFALIGYFYDTRKNQNDLFKKSVAQRETPQEEEKQLTDYNVPTNKSLKDIIATSDVLSTTESVDIAAESVNLQTEEENHNE